MDLVNHLEGRLMLAVPKKGRLQQAALDLIAGSDIQFRREHRLDIALVKNHPIALVFLPAADIPTFVGNGRVDLGITGRDQIEEHATYYSSYQAAGVEEILECGFGDCKLKVQVPELGDIKKPEQLIGKNVVTSFVGLTERYFAKLEGIELPKDSNVSSGWLKEKLKTKITYVSGSVEAACALGVADGIVDLVESGETMKAAGLIDIDLVVDSTAVLIKSRKPSDLELINKIASRIQGVINAQKYVLCQYNVPRNKLKEALEVTPGKRAATVTALDDNEWAGISVMVSKRQISEVMDRLVDPKVGATDVLVLGILNSRTD